MTTVPAFLLLSPTTAMAVLPGLLVAALVLAVPLGRWFQRAFARAANRLEPLDAPDDDGR